MCSDAVPLSRCSEQPREDEQGVDREEGFEYSAIVTQSRLIELNSVRNCTTEFHMQRQASRAKEGTISRIPPVKAFLENSIPRRNLVRKHTERDGIESRLRWFLESMALFILNPAQSVQMRYPWDSQSQKQNDKTKLGFVYVILESPCAPYVTELVHLTTSTL